MNTIWKYSLSATRQHQMPKGATVLHAAEQHGEICIWVLLDEKEPLEMRSFTVLGTGSKFEKAPGKFIGTVLLCQGQFVVHVFEDA